MFTQKQILTKLAQLSKTHNNNYCTDCNKKSTTWFDIKIGVFLCMECASLHRSLGQLDLYKS
jgi:hypothetical protein